MTTITTTRSSSSTRTSRGRITTPSGGTSQEYSFRSLDPRDLGGVDINFYLTGRALDNDATDNAAFHGPRASSSTASAMACSTAS
jgi:hypothetical protein